MSLAACGEMAALPISSGFGSQPTLPEPHPTLVPTVNIAPEDTEGTEGWVMGLVMQRAGNGSAQAKALAFPSAKSRRWRDGDQ